MSGTSGRISSRWPFGLHTCERCKDQCRAFEDILDYDLKDDEYYNYPHFNLRFNDENTPFSEVYYQKLETEPEVCHFS